KRGLVAQELDGVGTGVQTSELTGYDDDGRATSGRDADGYTTSTAYGADDEEAGETDPLGGTTAEEHDLAGPRRAPRPRPGPRLADARRGRPGQRHDHGL